MVCREEVVVIEEGRSISRNAKTLPRVLLLEDIGRFFEDNSLARKKELFG